MLDRADRFRSQRAPRLRQSSKLLNDLRAGRSLDAIYKHCDRHMGMKRYRKAKAASHKPQLPALWAVDGAQPHGALARNPATWRAPRCSQSPGVHPCPHKVCALLTASTHCEQAHRVAGPVQLRVPALEVNGPCITTIGTDQPRHPARAIRPGTVHGPACRALCVWAPCIHHVPPEMVTRGPAAQAPAAAARTPTAAGASGCAHKACQAAIQLRTPCYFSCRTSHTDAILRWQHDRNSAGPWHSRASSASCR